MLVPPISSGSRKRQLYYKYYEIFILAGAVNTLRSWSQLISKNSKSHASESKGPRNVIEMNLPAIKCFEIHIEYVRETMYASFFIAIQLDERFFNINILDGWQRALSLDCKGKLKCKWTFNRIPSVSGLSSDSGLCVKENVLTPGCR